MYEISSQNFTQSHEKYDFLKGVRVVPSEFGDLPGSLWVHAGVPTIILDALTSRNKQHHDNNTGHENDKPEWSRK
jgi:hypothetical protein